MATPPWIAYNDLAWVDTVVGSPADYVEETELYARLIRDRSQRPPTTLLHLGCGAGGNDFTFKRHFAVTGVDISPGMLEIARRVNPEVTYVLGDIRTIELPERFDAVAIPDCIDYMVTPEDLRAAIGTARRHLNPGGVLLIVANTRDEFRHNNFVYTGSRDDTEVTVLENDRICEGGARYEATLVYLIRRKGELRVETEVHTLGLFLLTTWLESLAGAGFDVEHMSRREGYERNILKEGRYPRRIFVATKTRKVAGATTSGANSSTDDAS